MALHHKRITPTTRHPKWFYIYYALALFNIISITTSLYINREIVEIQQQTAEKNKQWIGFQRNIAILSELALKVNAPANDIFKTKNIITEKNNYNRAYNNYTNHLSIVEKELSSYKDKKLTQNALDKITKATYSLFLHDIEVSEIFKKFSIGEMNKAAAHMSLMDQQFAKLATHLSTASMNVHDQQLAFFIEQRNLAEELKKYQRLIGILVLIMVIGSIKYGSTLRKHVQKNDLLKQQLLEELYKSNEELDEFCFIASHDLKEPLRAIHNHSEFLLEDYPKELGENGTKRIKRLLYLSDRMTKLINDLLYFARLGQEKMSVKEVSINDILNDLRRTMQDSITENNVDIIIPSSLPNMICNATQTTELFRNLITNAIKYNQQDKKTVEIGQNKKTFYVKDNGIGIEKEFHKEIFRIFKRLHSEKEYTGGTGAGLTFVKKIVEKHGGSIWLKSKPDEGSTFFFTLKGDHT